MNALLLYLFLPLAIGWVLGTIVFRDHPWAIAGWMPATALAGIGSFFFMIFFLGACSGSSGGGAAEGFHAMGQFALLPILMLFPMFLAMSWYIRPRGEPADAAMVLGIFVSMGVVAFFFLLASTSAT
jgi:hypothetical protein